MWKVVEAKCTPGSYAQKVRPKYSLASNAFSDFQDFAEWAQSSAGYLSKDENGRFWHLDKDILVKGNHVYGKDTCCFIPARVNTLLLTSRFSDSTLPLGVHFSANAQRFRAQTHIDKKDTMLGYFDSPEEAHSAWQRVKIDEILKVCRWYEELNGSSKKVVNALVGRVEQVRDDMLSGRITNSL